MASLPESASKEWENHTDPSVLATTNTDGIPNAIYVTCVRKFDEETFIIADNYLSKTRANLLAGSKGALLFITKEMHAFQVKGSLEYHTEGDYFENMKTWNIKGYPGHGAVVLRVEEVFNGAEKLA